MTEADPHQTDRLAWEVSRQFRKHIDATVVSGAGGQRPLFPPEAERLARIALRVVGEHLAKAVEPPSEDSMATDLDLALYGGMQMAADEIRALTAGLWDR
jgi:hypothetical protein